MIRTIAIIPLALFTVIVFTTTGYSKTIEDKLATENIQNLLASEQYEKLEAIADECRRNNVELKDGHWAVIRFYYSLVPLTEKSPAEEFPPLISKLQKWKKSMPKSPTPRVALIDAYTSLAYNARGTGWGDTVTDEGWKKFYELLDMAMEELKEPLIYSDPQAYVEKIITLRSVGGPDVKEQVLEWFEKGLITDDYYLPLYYQTAYTLSGRWYGTQGEWLRFIEAASKRLGGKRGKIIYTRVLWQMSYFYNGFDFLSKFAISWPDLKKTLKEFYEENPDSDVDLNMYAYFAAIALDIDTAGELITRIYEDNRRVPMVWSILLGRTDYFQFYCNVIHTRGRAYITVDLTRLWVLGQDIEEESITLTDEDGHNIDMSDRNRKRTLSSANIYHRMYAKRHVRALRLPADLKAGTYSITIVYRNPLTNQKLETTRKITTH